MGCFPCLKKKKRKPGNGVSLLNFINYVQSHEKLKRSDNSIIHGEIVGDSLVVGSLRLKKWPTTALFVTDAKLGTNDL